MNSKQSRQAREAEVNKARRAAARREREMKRAATNVAATVPGISKSPSRPAPRVQQPPQRDIAISDATVYAPEDRDGLLAIGLALGSLALLALLIIAVLQAA